MKIAPPFLGRASADLFHPLLNRMARNPGDLNASVFQMNEEQNVVSHQSSPRQHFHSEEVTASKDVHMSRKKVLPRRDLASPRSRSDAMLAQDVLDRLVRYIVPQVGQSRRFGRNPNPSSLSPSVRSALPLWWRQAGGPDTADSWTVELLGNEFSIPSENRVWLGNAGNLPECLSACTFSSFGQRGPFRVGQP